METAKREVLEPSIQQLGVGNDLNLSPDMHQEKETKTSTIALLEKGLCFNCEHVANCSLKSFEHFVLQCEHYE